MVLKVTMEKERKKLPFSATGEPEGLLECFLHY